MGFYSKRFRTLDTVPVGGSIGIPNDASNGGRALLLLAKYGLIRLKQAVGVGAAPIDITTNPQKLKIVQVDAAQLPRALDDVDAAAIDLQVALPRPRLSTDAAFTGIEERVLGQLLTRAA